MWIPLFFKTKYKKSEFIEGFGLKKPVELTVSDLAIIDEMVRIIENPNYISEARIKRESKMDSGNDVDEISFENATFSGDSELSFEFNSVYE